MSTKGCIIIIIELTKTNPVLAMFGEKLDEKRDYVFTNTVRFTNLNYILSV